MQVAIIHRAARTDREENILSLLRYFGDIHVFAAIEPYWETVQSAKATRGCTLSHLELIDRYNDPLLVLEDDATLRTGAWQEFLKVPLPKDAGAILLGCREEFGQPISEEFKHINGLFYGTQAILWFPRMLKERGFLYKAYKEVANNGMGLVETDKPCVCFESVILTAMRYSGLKLYRPSKMCFGMMDTPSDRDGQIYGVFNSSN